MTREEAINEIKSWAIPSEKGREVLETLIPELAESEDERIRKWLYDLVDEGAYLCERPFATESILAYLEKKKEQNQVESEGPHYTKRNALFDKCVENCDPDVMKKVSNEVDEMLQKEHEPIGTDFRAAVKNLMNLHKIKNEFTEEDYDFHAKELLELVEQKEQKHNYCLYGGYPNVGRCRWCYAACSARLADVHTDEEKEYIRTIKSIISDFIRDKKPENLAYYQRIYDWLDGRHVPFSCGHENGEPADPVFSKQEYESYPIISEDTTSAKPAELDGKALLYTADKSYQIGFRDGVASVKPEEWSKVTINSEPIPAENHSVDIPLAEWSKEDEEIYTFVCNFFETCWWSKTWDISREQVLQILKSLPEKFVLQPKQEWDVEDKLMIKCCLEAINVYKHKAKRGKFLPARFNIGGYLASTEKVESWLKFLPGRFNLQPKQEWSDEDEHRRDGIIQWLREYQEKFNPKYDSLSIEGIESLIDWLKSIRPSWKPSEEQIEELNKVRTLNPGLDALYQQLKNM